MKYNTRIAPSPTGFFHLGTARVAYHNWLMARATGGKFIVRIDDTDDNRNDQAYVDLIYKSLDWLGLDYDGTFTQSSRFKHHKDVAYLLLDKGLAQKDGDAIRLKTDYVLSTWKDMTDVTVKVSADDVKFAQNQVILKSNQSPIYHFASIVDDVDTDINLILRGADHISNTGKQLYILKALADSGYNNADMSMFNFCHVGLITVPDDNGKMIKLSKRDKRASFTQYQDDGYTKDAILNAVLRLGWAHTDPNFDKHQPLVNVDDALKFILQGKFKNKNAAFDLNKMNSLDKKYKNLLSTGS